MTEVTKDQFFAALYADPRDIMPMNVSTKGPGKSIWALNGVRNAPAFGESIGHDWTTNTPPRYWLAVVPVCVQSPEAWTQFKSDNAE
jgi:hypothetical protein